MSKPNDVTPDQAARIEAALGRVVQLRAENAGLRRQIKQAAGAPGSVVSLLDRRPRKAGR
ncbi:hypothetical protein [Nonomuraea ceibae]|uniref:hypothetical protein n=1 Tax=Nonomuraea ceibae TaxID=1935170 RepID=UPI001C607CF1|nr:hypothetical protein [Nonomuraea ceibae]